MASGNNIQDTIRETFKESLLYKDGLTLTIRCFIPELLTLIDEHIRGFFMMHNFGTRQRKGFVRLRLISAPNPMHPRDLTSLGNTARMPITASSTVMSMPTPCLMPFGSSLHF